jgi:hypothetical protein
MKTSVLIRSVLALLFGTTAYLAGVDISLKSGTLVSSAEARVGRPRTPMSYAGVARRTTRRAVAVGAAAGAAYAAPGCRRVVNSYGQWVTVCR